MFNVTRILYISALFLVDHATVPLPLYRQEGWRLEHENPQDPTTPIIFKGVVFNEMKGVFVSIH